MKHFPSPLLATRVVVIASAIAASACTTPAPGTAPMAGQQSTIEGKVVTVDTDPWAYDGNAVVRVATGSSIVAVQLPARWNLCKAQPLRDVQALKAGDRVQAIGTATAPGELVVCEQPQHLLRKLD